MKFLSKSSNYRIILKQGQPAEPLTGRTAVPGIYIKFEDGVANIDQDMGGISKEKICEMMLKHPAFISGDFIADKEGAKDPYAETRKPVEPIHTTMELKHGSIDKVVNPKPKLDLTDDNKKLLKEMAAKMAKEMVKEMIPVLTEKIVKGTKDNPTNQGPAPTTQIVKNEKITDSKNIKK